MATTQFIPTYVGCPREGVSMFGKIDIYRVSHYKERPDNAVGIYKPHFHDNMNRFYILAPSGHEETVAAKDGKVNDDC